jgi:hypothetical protein
MNSELMLDVGQANELKLAFRREGDWDNEKIKALTERRGLLTQVLDVLEGRAQITPVNGEVLSTAISPEGILMLSVDYSQTLEQMIAAGRYDWKNDDLTAKRFPIKGEGTEEVEAKLFHFGRSISSEDAKRLIEEAGWEVAKTEHLLAFGVKHPDEQRKFPIIALGSVGEVGGDRGVPCLDGSGSERSLGLRWWGYDWNSDCRFLAVRKKVS